MPPDFRYLSLQINDSLPYFCRLLRFNSKLKGKIFPGETNTHVLAGKSQNQSFRRRKMKSRARNLCSLGALAAILTGAGAANVAFAQGDDVGYKVVEDRTETPDEHNNAVYATFESQPNPERKFGMVFMQTQGVYAFKPFNCLDAEWHPSLQSFTCSETSTIDGLQLLETVTIGRLTGGFCTYLRIAKGSGVVIEPADCASGAGTCSCYEIIHQCRENDDDEWDEDLCPIIRLR